MFKLKTIAVAAGLMALPAMSQAAAPTLSDVLGSSGISVSGAIDASYDWSDADAVANRQFDVSKNSFSLHQVNLLVTKSFSDGFSATVNGVMGDDVAIINPGATEFDLTQAYLSYSVGGVTISGGRMVTLAGYEVINPAGNANASRSLLFFNQPLVHTGVRASFKVSDALSLTVGLNNAGIGTGKVDNNTDKTIEAQIAFTPMSALSVYLTGYKGNEDAGAGVLNADFVDLVVNLTLNDMLSVGLNADYQSIEDGGTGHVGFTGIGAYVTANVLPKLSVTARGESLAFDTGAGTQTLSEGTLTVAYAVTNAFSVLTEVRADSASDLGAGAYSHHGAAGDSKYQNTATVKGIYKF